MEEGTAVSAPPSEPPPLPYSLRDRKKSIAIFWAIFVIDTLGQPVALYWGLWYATDLSHNLVFSIVTACLGGVSVFEYFYRLYNLFRKNSRARPLNARKSWVCTLLRFLRMTMGVDRLHAAGLFSNQFHHCVADPRCRAYCVSVCLSFPLINHS